MARLRRALVLCVTAVFGVSGCSSEPVTAEDDASTVDDAPSSDTTDLPDVTIDTSESNADVSETGRDTELLDAAHDVPTDATVFPDASPNEDDLGTGDATVAPDTFASDATSELDVFDGAIEDAVAADTLAEDTFAPDTFAEDAFAPDTFAEDTFAPDTFAPDTFAPDTFAEDTFTPDTFAEDTFAPDTFGPDTLAGEDVRDTAPALPDVVPDVGAPDCETPPPVGAQPYVSIIGARLYAGAIGTAVRACWTEYAPAHSLWSDGLIKRRFVYLPSGTKISTGPNPISGAAPNMDRWVMPIGARFIKEFSRADGKRLETRIWERTVDGYRMGSFRWLADQSDAIYTEGGGAAALPLDDGITTHTIPKRAECFKCHDGEPGKALGFSGVQLSKPSTTPTELTLLRLIERDLLSHPPSSMPTAYGSPVPGTAVQAAALGALHASCGHCHNPQGDAQAMDMVLRISWGEATATTTGLFTTTVGVETKKWNKSGITFRIDPGTSAAGDGVPNKSAIYFRASTRGTPDEMPPLGTILTDQAGLAALDAWIRSL